MRKDIDFITEVLYEARKKREHKSLIQKGIGLRKAMWDAINADPSKSPDNNYRFDFLSVASARVFEKAVDLCKEFDSLHEGEDKSSTLDLVDILQNATNLAKAHHNAMVQAKAPTPPVDKPPGT